MPGAPKSFEVARSKAGSAGRRSRGPHLHAKMVAFHRLVLKRLRNSLPAPCRPRSFGAQGTLPRPAPRPLYETRRVWSRLSPPWASCRRQPSGDRRGITLMRSVIWVWGFGGVQFRTRNRPFMPAGWFDMGLMFVPVSGLEDGGKPRWGCVGLISFVGRRLRQTEKNKTHTQQSHVGWFGSSHPSGCPDVT